MTAERGAHQAQSTQPIGTLAIVGVGLIGGSFALALKKRGMVKRVWGVGRSAQTVNQAIALGVVDEAVDLQKAASEADLIMMAAPVGAFAELFGAMAPHLARDVVITDGGSTKGNVVAAARAGLGSRIGQFVPAHPIAGSHESGPQAALADLYCNRHVVICPLPENTPAAIERVSNAWQACGAQLVTMDVQQHDEVLAAVSHLPHWLASLYVEHVARDRNADLNLQLAGAGFGDFSRIAQGSVEMWRDIFLANRGAMLQQITELHALLGQARDALEKNDEHWLEQTLAHAAQVRRRWGEKRERACSKGGQTP